MKGNNLVPAQNGKDADITYILGDVASMFGLKASTIIKWVKSGRLTASYGKFGRD